MTDALFNADPYGPGRTPRRPAEDRSALVTNDGEWFVLLRHNKPPDPLAHRLDAKVMTVYVNGKKTMGVWDGVKPWDGAWQTKCGMLGAVIDLPPGEVRACPKCV